MIKEICVIGHPSLCGGADTELLDQIKCWTKMGIKTYICHTGPILPNLKALDLENKYGCVYLKSRQWYEVKGMHCVSFCNGTFLENLRHIKKFAKTTTFVNCMTFNFQKEIQCQYEGLIDFHLYQTNHAFEKISKNLQAMKNYRPIMFRPYFDTESFPFYETRYDDHFRFGRISRCDLSKFSADQLFIYDNMKSEKEKSGIILGWDNRVKDKYHVQNADLSMVVKDGIQANYYKNYIQLFREGTLSQKDFYKFCDVMILSADTFENLPRVGFEAMSSGTIMVVNDRGGWQLQVDDNITGMLCKNTKEFVEKSSLLAQNKGLRDQIRGYARERLLRDWGIENSMKSWENIFFEWEKKSQ